LAIDPLKAIGATQMVGYPETFIASGRAARSNRYVPIIWGVVCLIGAFYIFIKFSGWWTYILGGILLMLGWVSLKTGFFASQKEIKELTEPGPVSAETKKKFQDRL
jgi:hypothetical protein